MKNPTVAEALGLHEGQVLRQRQLILVNGHLTPEASLKWGEFAEYELRLLIRRMHVMDETTTEFVLQEMRPALVGCVAGIVDKLDTVEAEIVTEPFVLAIADGTWIHWTDHGFFYHAKSLDKVRHLGNLAPIFSVAINLPTLLMKAVADLHRYRRNKNDQSDPQSAAAEIQDSKRTLAESGLLRDDADSYTD